MDVQELPDPAGLTDLQRRGRECVGCSAALSNATAVDLGARPDAAIDHRVDLFPRACPACAKGGAA
jgi:hypothetical protein